MNILCCFVQSHSCYAAFPDVPITTITINYSRVVAIHVYSVSECVCKRVCVCVCVFFSTRKRSLGNELFLEKLGILLLPVIGTAFGKHLVKDLPAEAVYFLGHRGENHLPVLFDASKSSIDFGVDLFLCGGHSGVALGVQGGEALVTLSVDGGFELLERVLSEGDDLIALLEAARGRLEVVLQHGVTLFDKGSEGLEPQLVKEEAEQHDFGGHVRKGHVEVEDLTSGGGSREDVGEVAHASGRGSGERSADADADFAGGYRSRSVVSNGVLSIRFDTAGVSDWGDAGNRRTDGAPDRQRGCQRTLAPVGGQDAEGGEERSVEHAT
mmetsp:Transcript_13387/g.24236  ORF Transcript_13387/g.24236 Transcript_13387/m.24236 type:complete len:325 (+) Transcript_13387:445-1419(+)